MFRFAVVGDTLCLYQNTMQVLSCPFTPYSFPLSDFPYISLALDLAEGGAAAITNFVCGSVSPAPPPVRIPLPFSLRATAAVTTFACMSAAQKAQSLTNLVTGSGTRSSLQTVYYQLYFAYLRLQHQDVVNQKMKLDAAVTAAQTAILALNAIVSTMTPPSPPPDNADALPNIQLAVANAVTTIANCKVDEAF